MTLEEADKEFGDTFEAFCKILNEHKGVFELGNDKNGLFRVEVDLDLLKQISVKPDGD